MHFKYILKKSERDTINIKHISIRECVNLDSYVMIICYTSSVWECLRWT